MKKLLTLLLAALMMFSLAACAETTEETTSGAETTTEETTTEETTESTDTAGAIRVGGIGPITGGAAVYGTAVKNAAELAVQEINAMGGLQFELNYQDDEHDPEKAVNAYNTLKDWDMQILMGTVTSAPSIAVAAESVVDNMFQITPSATAEEAIANDNAFRICFSDPQQGQISAEYIQSTGLATKVAVIYNSADAYSSGIHDAFIAKAAELNLEVVADESFTDDSNTDFNVQLQKAKDAGAELVFLPIYYTEASLILTQADSMGYEPTFFGCDGLDGVLTVENFDTSLADGVMLLTPFSVTAEDEQTANFVAAYNAAYGENPNQFAASAYDAMFALYEACTTAGITSEMSASDVCDALIAEFTQMSVDGVTGKSVTWDASGAPTKAPSVYVIQDGAYVLAE